MSLITLPHAIFIYDEAGNPVPITSGSLITSGSRGFIVYGKDGNNEARNFVVDASGSLAIQNPPNLDVALSTRLSQATFTSSVGEVQTSPTANTVLGRLKDINVTLTSSLGTLGQKAMTGSTPVVIASNQSEFPVVQGTAAALSGAWPVKITDGTNIQPVGDVQSRAVFNYITDGVNGAVSVKTGSTSAVAADRALVTALSPNTQLPAGTNTIGYVMQGLSSSLSGAWPVRVTDGTNIQPTGDSVARSIYMQITDGGTGSVSVKGPNLSPTVLDKSLVVQISPNQNPIPTSVVPSTAIPGSVIGRASGLTANTFVPVRQTNYIEQTTAAQRSFASTNANDSSAGTGARQIILYYLNAAGQGPFTEIITLNGTTAVNTTNTDICFIERILVMSVGSNGSNVGTINMYTGTGATGTIFASIGVGAIATGIGDNETLWAQHYVPSGSLVSGYFVSCGIIAAAGGGSSTSIIRYRDPTVSTSPWRLASDIINAAQGNSANRTYYVSIKISGPAVIAGYATPANNNSIATLSFDYSDEPI